MSVNQSKNIKSNSTTERTPRSMRLNKGHREDSISKIMKAWTEANPMPFPNVEEEHFKHLFTELMAVPDDAPIEQQHFKINMEATKAAYRIKKKMPNELQKVVSFGGGTNIKLQTILANDDKGALRTLEIPVALADKLKIPYVGTNTTYSYSTPTSFSTYWTKETGSDCYKMRTIKYVCIHSSVTNIPHDSPATKAYVKQKTANAKWQNQRETMEQEVRDILEQFNTTGQLRDSWPDVVQYLPPHLADPEAVVRLPALAVSRLNERLGLK